MNCHGQRWPSAPGSPSISVRAVAKGSGGGGTPTPPGPERRLEGLTEPASDGRRGVTEPLPRDASPVGGSGAPDRPRPPRLIVDEYCEICFAPAITRRPGRRALCMLHLDLELADEAWDAHKDREQAQEWDFYRDGPS